jgi:TRAP-type C4-dicarboxylate transport system permease large subunit
MGIGEMLTESRFLIAVLCFVFAIIGSMYFGWATATEAAAVGVWGAALTVFYFVCGMFLGEILSTILTRAGAEAEVVKCVRDRQQPHHKYLLLECTNLPPYKAALARQTY